MDLTVGVGEPFRVPLRASYVEVIGEDAEGALLLAVVPLPAPEAREGDGVEHLAVNPRRLSGSSFGIGRRVLASIVLGERRDRIRWLAGYPIKNRPESKCLRM
jgi:hypothetical protein